MTNTKKPTITIHNATTNEVIEREMTNEEFSNYEQAAIQDAANKADAETKATARAAILDRLGLTADEAALLLG
jgi:hypothetical protein